MRKRISVLVAIFMASLAALAAGTVALASMPGALWTTDAGGNRVDQNIYAYKVDVYLNGGPRSGGGGLPDGDYYVKVTAPNGVLLGTSVGSPVPKPVHVTNGKFDQVYKLYDIVWTNSTGVPVDPVQPVWPGYADTPNNGHEYKVWISQNPEFPNSESKTDNFKVMNTGCPPGSE